MLSMALTFLVPSSLLSSAFLENQSGLERESCSGCISEEWFAKSESDSCKNHQRCPCPLICVSATFYPSTMAPSLIQFTKTHEGALFKYTQLDRFYEGLVFQPPVPPPRVALSLS